MNKSEWIKLRADLVTIQKLDQLAQNAGGNRSEVVRRLIDQAANASQQQPKPVKALAD